MATRRTKEEKLKLIADYEASSLSMSEWCNANDISKSTLAGWIQSTKADVCLVWLSHNHLQNQPIEAFLLMRYSFWGIIIYT